MLWLTLFSYGRVPMPLFINIGCQLFSIRHSLLLSNSHLKFSLKLLWFGWSHYLLDGVCCFNELLFPASAIGWIHIQVSQAWVLWLTLYCSQREGGRGRGREEVFLKHFIMEHLSTYAKVEQYNSFYILIS